MWREHVGDVHRPVKRGDSGEKLSEGRLTRVRVGFWQTCAYVWNVDT